MKTFRYIFSNVGIIAAIATLLTIALVLAFVGIGIESQNQVNGIAAIAVRDSDSIVMYVMSGVMGNIPSVAGTLQSYALALAYGLTPLVVVLMFAARTFVKASTSDDRKAFA